MDTMSSSPTEVLIRVLEFHSFNNIQISRHYFKHLKLAVKFPYHIRQTVDVATILFDVIRYLENPTDHSTACTALSNILTARAKWFEHFELYSKAYCDYTRAICLCPYNLEGYINRLNFNLNVNNWWGATYDAQHAINIHEECAAAYFGMGWALYNLGIYNCAFEHFDVAYDLDPNNPVYQYYQTL